MNGLLGFGQEGESDMRTSQQEIMLTPQIKNPELEFQDINLDRNSQQNINFTNTYLTLDYSTHIIIIKDSCIT